MASSAHALVVFDFDNTLVLDNTDTRPFELLAPDLLRTFLRDPQLGKASTWTELIGTALKELSSRDVTPTQILSAVATAPFPPATRDIIRSIALSTHAEAAIISDANDLYIDACLHANSLSTAHFSAGVYTNYARVDGDQIELTPFAASSPHHCHRCPANLCKTTVLRNLIARYPDCMVLYVGDGGNDYCPAASLPEHSLVLPREGFPLEQHIIENPVLAKVSSWASPDEMTSILRRHLPVLS